MVVSDFTNPSVAALLYVVQHGEYSLLVLHSIRAVMIPMVANCAAVGRLSDMY